MRKVIAAFNMTIDGFCDHTEGIPSEGLHQHYAELLNNSGVILYGRITYQLMTFWKTLVKNPSGKKTMDDFAIAIDKVPKIVFSHTLKDPEWHSAEIANKPIEEVLRNLKQQPGNDISVGSRSLIIQLLNLQLIDEFQLCVHPLLVGKGLPLFDKINDRTTFSLLKTKTLDSGSIVLYYKPTR